MKDSNDHNVDSISDQIKSTRNKTRRMKSSNKIYERFVERVEAIGHKEKSRHPAKDKSLNLEGLPIWDYSKTSDQDLKNQDTDQGENDSIEQNAINDITEDNSLSTDIDIGYQGESNPSINASGVSQSPSEVDLFAAKQDKQKSKFNIISRKNLIISSIVLVLFTGAIMVVIASGKFSYLNNSATEVPIINTEPALKEEKVNPPADSDTVSTDESAAIASTVLDSVAKLELTISDNHLDIEDTTGTIIKKEGAVIENEVVENANPDQNLEAPTTPDKEKDQTIGISIEDFKQESQSTLYRE
ncbi:hypothetical protein [Psychrobacter jeotgali]|uniref:hypothetical protein n=1 Tax=Psychrobacter jeotgali TaxID=179010 RepID=UPI00191AAF14|nr:hypothetical protein [Psychrobacter jeotgali]